MAWVEGQTWTMEQGVDALIELRLFSNTEQTTPWAFTGWTLVAVIGNDKNKKIADCVVDATPATGIAKFILPEASVNALVAGRDYYFDALFIAPTPDLADDYHAAYLPVAVKSRPARRAV